MRQVLLLSIVATATLLVLGCSSDVPSGSYTGVIEKVNADEKEIYVKRDDDGSVLELYFTDTTVVTKGIVPAAFSDLAKGQKVNVTLENEDGKLKPTSVSILQ